MIRRMDDRESILEIMDAAVRDVTKRMAGIELARTEQDALLECRNSSALFVEVSGDRAFTLVYSAENSLLWAIAEKMKRRPVSDMEEAAEYTKEYFNVICGHVVSAINRRMKSSLRFGIPHFQPGIYVKGLEKSAFALFYQSREGAARMQSAR